MMLLVLFLLAPMAFAQEMTMPGMAAMENTVGFLSSGTSVEPKNTSESAPIFHTTVGNWIFMFHADGFLADTQQSGPRGRDKLYSVNWLMPMLAHDFGRQSVSLRTMLSLEPATVTHRRYPELFQSGETAYGAPIVDGQHPHELLMELAGRYDVHLTERTRLFVYGGPLGEPALGPTAFSHRASASENPVAVLGHHQQDSTHISNSVITIGFAGGPIQLEASTFHGREPNENRWNIDGGKPDSFASRVSLGLGDRLSGQFSVGRINNREILDPKQDTFRMTASIHHNVSVLSGHLASSVIWGRNKDLHGHENRIFNAYTLESTLNFRGPNWAWTRIENLDRDRTLIRRGEEKPIGRVQAYTFGYERDLPWSPDFLNVGLGVQASVYGMTAQLKPIYGEHPAGVTIFLHFRPTGNIGPHMQMMHQQH